MTKKVKDSLKNTGILILYSLFILGLGFIAYRIGIESATRYEEFNVGALLMSMGLIILSATVMVYLHVVIHELGHLVAGLLSGYTFMLFRIGSFGIIKEEKKFKTISFSMSGTMGQCLMNPPESISEVPYRLYLSGGVLANLIVSIGSVLLYAVNPTDYLLLFAFIGLTSGLMNGIPIGFNDAKVLSKLRKSNVAQDQFFQQLRWNGQFIRYNKTYSEVGKEEKIINAQEPITEQFNIYTKLIEMSSLLEQKQFEEAYQELAELYDQVQAVIAPYRSEIIREYLYCTLILDKGNPQLVKEIRSNRLFQDHLKRKQVDVYRIRSVIAYYCDNNRVEAEKLLSQAVDHLDKAPAFADKEVNRILLNHLKDIMAF
ncbi:hypothetical protein [Alkalibacterium olivapovliticus]|uniref:Uncharacterized protein n=1 Tax=Alkalibacterium olivapovliticus TaxID=99907 RepID=A0A2T0W5V2_9LACT|nr:hypothetical protein [Alkalibacterium olivapovliticus]PRY81456.1 hypothetical protein CLV38_11747 [Alkalibacterium olivapovliticus]